MTEEGPESLGCTMQHNRAMDTLRLPLGDVTRFRRVEYFTSCNKFGLWDIIRNENDKMIPWHKTFFVLLNCCFGMFCLGGSLSYRFSLVFMVLQSRPDIVVGKRNEHTVSDGISMPK
mmetsp:Transcript_10851/g.25161  ORF Transcript_10851/g.25161 Transcript_10851/m.25161 type:complete len:117 (+) Transcript_10851:3-353(+)